MKNLILLFSIAIIGFGCAKKENNNPTPAVGQYAYINGQCVDQTNNVQVNPTLCTSNGYTYQNGVCIQTSTGQQVPPTYCQNTSSNGYTYQNGICIQTSTGQQVPPTYCQNQTGGQQCYGPYIYVQNGFSQQVQCAGANCRGYTLISQATNQQVYCQ